jgi:hypothetical protein
MMAAPSRADQPGPGGDTPSPDLSGLFHRLNNQLGIILANAELLESRLTDTTQRARAGQVVSSVLEAIATVQQVRRVTDTSTASDK